jgi:YegS/Rv2252/BmrU family lipid kinase
MPDSLFIINPTSARGTTLKRWKTARQEFLKAGLRFEERPTTCAGEATEITKNAIKSGVKCIIAVGGDGTLNEVVNGYLDESGKAIDAEAAIGLLPSGTGSDFRRSLGLMKKADAMDAIIAAKTRWIDVVNVEFENRNGEKVRRYSINMVSFGLGGDVTNYVNSWRETVPNWIGGKLRFAAAAVFALKEFKAKNVALTIDDKDTLQIQSNLLVISNGRFAGGGMMLAPHAELDDGLLEVIVTDRARRLDVIKELRRIYSGGLLKNPKVSLFKAKTVAIASDEKLMIDIDGETAGFTPARLTIFPAAVRFIN